ncbi:MAG TPA: signal recognition particle-docking protein FtsY [Candidatus Saccharicenans sp.]|nr:signal recognition particle-docking protein FtsY [Candidatus Saccharicenans sp.]HOL45974.1 signal recognition particle-docking protein FtsY [Candidatus Saccharicenans sp.]HOM94833.1 signal recognition particle-docking protein FtsY [Candidatus Saccharicenans sp.]HPP24703.1 signal recognition particle-docking protein FtsY [Candidatus Saccharicenans sp.]
MLEKLKETLSKTRKLFTPIEQLFSRGQSQEEILDELFELLILADVGVATSQKIINDLKEKTRKSRQSDLKALLKQELIEILAARPSAVNETFPAVWLLVGVNGGGKTTSAAKLAYKYQSQGRKVMLAAADTFRAAAQEQLALWGKKLNLPVIQGQPGADPASVVYDALQSFQAKNYDLLIIDTAGRLHTYANLMAELEKIKKVISREIPGAPQEILLVLDSTIGQNAIVQAREFNRFSGLTGVFLTKLDGTARGGSVLAVVEELQLPIKFVGLGETEKDIMEFEPEAFVEALLS